MEGLNGESMKESRNLVTRGEGGGGRNVFFFKSEGKDLYQVTTVRQKSTYKSVFTSKKRKKERKRQVGENENGMQLVYPPPSPLTIKKVMQVSYKTVGKFAYTKMQSSPDYLADLIPVRRLTDNLLP